MTLQAPWARQMRLNHSSSDAVAETTTPSSLSAAKTNTAVARRAHPQYVIGNSAGVVARALVCAARSMERARFARGHAVRPGRPESVGPARSAGVVARQPPPAGALAASHARRATVHALRRNWAAALEHEWRLLRELSGASAADVDAAPQLLLIAVDRCVASAVAYRAAIVHGPSGILVDSVGSTNRPTADLTARLLQYSDVALAYSCCPAPSANTSVWHEFLDSLRDRYPHSGVVCCIGAGTGEIT
eukprot:ctg_1194.g262